MLIKTKKNPFIDRNIRLLDTTLRDGEQTPGVSLSVGAKVEIALNLARLGVPIIEAGSAITSEGERKAICAVVEAIKNHGFNTEIASFCRIKKEDIDFAIGCKVDSIHLVVPVSDLHITQRLKKDRETVLQIAVKMTKYAKNNGLIVEISGEDASRADLEYLKSVYAACIEAGADRICFCDTVGQLTTETAYEIFSDLASAFDVPIAVHCHNDFGLAVANTIAALRAGASEAHVTVNGIGERAGNTAFEEVTMTLESLYGFDTGVECEKIYEISRLVSRLTGIPIAPNKAIVGGNAFSHEAGIHVHGLMANKATYEPFAPELVGRKRKIVLGKHAGKSSIIVALAELGLEANEKQLDEILARVKELGDKGKHLTDADIEIIAKTVLEIVSDSKVKLEEFTVVSGNTITPTASVKLRVNGSQFIEAAVGDGPVDAAISAIRKAVSKVADVKLEEYHVDAVTGGTDALVEVTVKLSLGDRVIISRGVRSDIIMASVEAVLEGINRLIK